jgi:hypothetical protein
MVQLSATGCSCIAILCVSLVSFSAITLCVASQRVFIFCCLFRYRLSPGNFWIYPRMFMQNVSLTCISNVYQNRVPFLRVLTVCLMCIAVRRLFPDSAFQLTSDTPRPDALKLCFSDVSGTLTPNDDLGCSYHSYHNSRGECTEPNP